ncbi:DUF6776 family protein [Neptunicella sp. SCSIO 80796]|uniref:DUF6776 family protein n=1 Tax=Neptunicella plasticusilytica TaxID=3117012 RepID=UPI003A4E0E35
MKEIAIKQRIGAFKFYAICLLVICLVAYLGYCAGQAMAEYQRQQIAGMQASIDKFNDENNKLIKQLNILGVELEIEKRANLKAQQDLQQAFSDNQQIRNQLSFYQKVMAPELSDNGFVIDSINFQSTNVEQHFRYSLVLLQQQKRKNFVKGDIRITLQGSSAGQMKEVDMLAQLDPPKTSLTFHFRYFETLNGEVDLPAGFMPEKIVIHAKLSSQGSNNAEHERRFDWLEVLDQAREE